MTVLNGMFGGIEVEQKHFDFDTTEHAIQHRHRELLASVIVRRVAGGVGRDRRRERWGSGSLRSVTHGAVGLESRGTGGIADRGGLCSGESGQ